MNYLVMECHPGYAVVLSQDGRFLKVANMHYTVGQTVKTVTELSLPQSQAGPVKFHNRRWLSGLAALAACLTLAVTSLFLYGQMPYASVYMTVNPEVCIVVNRADRVLEVEGMNADGMALLQDYTPDRKHLDTVMDELVDRTIDMGYLHQGGRITLSLEGNESWVSSHGSHLQTQLKTHLEEKLTVTIEVRPKGAEPAEEAAPTAPAGPVVIPVAPEEYGDSDYGDTDEEDTDYDTDDAEADHLPSNDDRPDHLEEDDSDYGQSDYGQSDYDQSDYGQSEYDD